MPLKRIVAREWLIFLAVFFLSPLVLASYQWVSVESDSWPLLPFWLGPVPTNHEILKDNSQNIFQPHGSSEGVKDTGNSPSSQAPQGELQWWAHPGSEQEFLASTPQEAQKLYEAYTKDKSEPKLTGKVRPKAPAASVAELETTWERKPLWNYLAEVMTDVSAYLGILIIYPLLLVIRSVVWSIRALRHRE
jgi:hypothetical protein